MDNVARACNSLRYASSNPRHYQRKPTCKVTSENKQVRAFIERATYSDSKKEEQNVDRRQGE